MSALGPKKRWTDTLLSFVTVRLALWVALARYVVPGWLDHPWNLLEYMDDHQHHGLDVVGRLTYLKYHQFPLWNPYWCGGTAGIGEPEAIYLSPDFLLRALFYGVERGRHLILLFGFVLAMEGMYRLARKFEASAIASAYVAMLWPTQAFLVTAVQNGAHNFLIGFALIPWALLAFYEGLDSVPWRVFGGFIVAWILLCAGTYPTPYTLFALFLCALGVTAAAWARGQKREWRKPWFTLVTMGVVSFGLSAPKLFPLLGFLGSNKRTWLAVETNSAGAMFTELSNRYPWLLVAAFVALLFLDRWAAFFVGLAALFFTVSLGDFDPLAPYHLIHKLPLLGQLRQPERYQTLTILFLSVAAARGLTLLEDAAPALLQRLYGRDPAPRPLRALAVLAGAGLLGFVLYPRAKTAALDGMVAEGSLFVFEAPRKLDQPFRQARGNRRDIHAFNDAGLGSLYCIVGIPVPQSPALRADLPAEEYPLDPSKAKVTRLEWTPNWIDLQVEASEPTRVLVNQNWHKHFRSTVGKVANHEGLLAIDVPAGNHKLRIAYVDRGFQVGLVLASVTILALLAYAGWYLKRRVSHLISRYRALPFWPPLDG